MEDAGLSKTQAKKKRRQDREASASRGPRSHSKSRDPSTRGLHTEEAVAIAKKLDRQGRKGWHGGSGEGDQRKAVHLVKWMNTGKKRMGTHYQR